MRFNKINFLLYILFFNSIFAQEVEVLVHKSQVNIEELKGLNTKYRECNLSLMPNGKTLYFMSTRNRSGKEGMGDGDIYRAVKSGQEWSGPEFVSQINTYSGEDEPSVSYDGEKIYFQSWKSGWEGTGGPYYEATIENGILKNIRGLGGGINQFFRREYRANYRYATDGMAISPDGKLFIVACGRDYDGNMNLFYSIKKFGVWSFPELFNVSTRGDERSVYIASDNQTIYFSSDGHGGFGGLDIFKTTFNGFTTSAVSNIGEPFNTSKDDMGFVISGQGEAAYFIRDLDIFYANLSDINAELKPSSSSLIFGKVLLNNEPAQSKVVVTSNNQVLGTAVSDENGRYSISVSKRFSNADVFIEDENSIFKAKKIFSSDKYYEEFELNFIGENKQAKANIEIANIENEVNSEKALNETIIYFSFDDSSIDNAEFLKLKKLLNNTHSGCIILIEGHTDRIGSNDYNEELSRKRAESVQNWFIKYAGLKKSQIDLRFKGESETLNLGTTDNQRAENRRVTVKILSH